MNKLVIWGMLLLAVGCGGATGEMNVAKVESEFARTAQPSVTPAPELLTSEQVMAAFKGSGLPVINEIVYTESTDPNNLLGRPGQYVGKVNFLDSE